MKIIRLLCVIALIVGACSPALAEEDKRIAAIAEVKGTVEVKTAQGKWIPAQLKMVLNQGDMIRTRKDSSALLNLDGMAQTATVEVKQNSQLRLAELVEDKKETVQTTLLDLALGEILIQAKKLHSEKARFEVKTPTSIVGVRGTTFAVSVEAVE